VADVIPLLDLGGDLGRERRQAPHGAVDGDLGMDPGAALMRGVDDLDPNTVTADWRSPREGVQKGVIFFGPLTAVLLPSHRHTQRGDMTASPSWVAWRSWTPVLLEVFSPILLS
jgi:hypothetical protein